LAEHLDHALARALRARGIDVLTPMEAGLRGAADVAYLAYGRAHARGVITSDRDFLRLNRRSQDHAGIAYCPASARSIGDLISLVTALHQAFSAEERAARVEYL